MSVQGRLRKQTSVEGAIYRSIGETKAITRGITRKSTKHAGRQADFWVSCWYLYNIYGGRDQSTPHASVRRRQDVPVSGTGNKLRVAFGMAGSNEPTTAAWSRNSDRCIVLAAVFCIWSFCWINLGYYCSFENLLSSKHFRWVWASPSFLWFSMVFPCSP